MRRASVARPPVADPHPVDLAPLRVADVILHLMQYRIAVELPEREAQREQAKRDGSVAEGSHLEPRLRTDQST